MRSNADGESSQERTAGVRLSVAETARGTLVSVGPSLVLDLLAIGSTVAVASGWLKKPKQGSARLVRPLVLAGAALPWVYCLAIRPWHRRWGASDEEVRMPLPGDELVPEPGYEHTRAVTVQAPAEEVWSWLAQIGQNRGGFYSYDWLENLAGCDIHSADRVHPEWHDPRPGDTIAVLRGWGPKLLAVEPGRSLVIDGWGTYTLRPVDEQTTRLLARARHPRGWAALAYLLTLEIPHFIMERAMLLGLKRRAERAAGTGRPSDLAAFTHRYPTSTERATSTRDHAGAGSHPEPGTG